MIALVLGFLIFHILEKSILIQHCHEDSCVGHKHPQIGVISALALAGHSFMDGVGIGLGFQVNPAVGLLVAIAVLSHDFNDGMNTVTLMLNNKNTDRKIKNILAYRRNNAHLGCRFNFIFQSSSSLFSFILRLFRRILAIYRSFRYFTRSACRT